jgi:hypothetical protein
MGHILAMAMVDCPIRVTSPGLATELPDVAANSLQHAQFVEVRKSMRFIHRPESWTTESALPYKRPNAPFEDRHGPGLTSPPIARLDTLADPPKHLRGAVGVLSLPLGVFPPGPSRINVASVVTLSPSGGQSPTSPVVKSPFHRESGLVSFHVRHPRRGHGRWNSAIVPGTTTRANPRRGLFREPR